MKRLEGYFKVAVIAIALHTGAQAAPKILANNVQGTNCAVTVTLETLTAAYPWPGGLTYTFVPVGAGTQISFNAPTNPIPVPHGSYTLWLTVGPYPSTSASSMGYPVTVAPCPLSNTGLGDPCTALKVGDVDPHWQLATPWPSAPSGTIPLPEDPTSSSFPLGFGPVYVANPDSWFANNGASQWLTPSMTGTATTPELGGEFVYRTTFESSPGNSIAGWYWSDNELLGVYLNGTLLQSFPLNGPSSFGKGAQTPFNITTGLTAVNTLDFVVRNRGQGGIDTQPTETGLRVQFNGGGCQHVLSQWAVGGGWYSALYIANPTPFEVTVPVSFFTDSGALLSLQSLGGSSTTVRIPAQGTTTIEGPNSGSLIQGYASTLLPNGVVGYGVFRQSVQGVNDQEAVVPLALAGTSTATLVYDETNYTTAVAIANPSGNTENVTITVWDSSGTLIGTSSVTLAPNGKTEAALRTLSGLGGMVGKRGLASFVVAQGGSITVLGLRFNGLAFTSIPVSAQ